MSKLISGPSLCCFFGTFESDFGNETTDALHITITPSFIGNSLLPFRCPHCAGVPQALACPKTRKKYKDTRPGRSNYFCPLCGCRFKLNLQGTPLPSDIKAGAKVAPSKIEQEGRTYWQDKPGIVDHVLGTLLQMIYTPVSYDILGRI